NPPLNPNTFPSLPPLTPPSRRFTSAEFSEWHGKVERFYQRGFWLSEWGGKPGSDDYQGPKELVRMDKPQTENA
ncbi:MAG TPA: hypothetical protein VHB73_08135, partial [Alphaproteobacteria bacterium]|nr:hypothetical protein [Alphaproteobacteria bacterium]